MQQAMLIFNPVAGKGNLKNNLFKVVDRLTKAGYLVSVYPTQGRGDGRKQVAALEGQMSLLVVSGGDGTLREIVSGYVENETLNCPIAYLPVGTTNDFARTLHLSTALERSLEIACQGQAQPIDVGAFNGEHFVYIAAFGAFTEVSYSTPQVNKSVLGHFAYILEGITQLSQLKKYDCFIEDDTHCFEGEFLFAMVCNSDSVAGMKRRVGPKADLADGYFEACFVRVPKTLQDLRKIVANLLVGEYDGEQVVVMRTSHLSVYSREPIRWTLDGEDGGFHEMADISNLPQAIAIMVKPEDNGVREDI